MGSGGADFSSLTAGITSIGINGTIGGITNLLQGGNFGDGFVSAGAGVLAGSFGARFGTQIGSDLGGASGAVIGRIIGGAVAGGTASKLTGGKFANGAMTAAFAAAVGEAMRMDSSAGDMPDIRNKKVAGHVQVTEDGNTTQIKVSLTASYDATVKDVEVKDYVSQILKYWNKTVESGGRTYVFTADIEIIGKIGLFTPRGNIHITSCASICSSIHPGASSPERMIMYRYGSQTSSTPAHEFGHILGLDHRYSQPSIMGDYRNPSRSVTGYDLQRTSQLYGGR